MTVTRIYLITLFFLLLGVGVARSQERSISEAEYNAANAKAYAVLQNAKFRETRKVDTRDSADLPWKPYSFTVDEHIKPDRSRTQITILDRGQTEPQTDLIRIGETVYIKRPDGNWVEDRYRVAEAGTNNPYAPRTINEYKHLGYDSNVSSEATLFQKISRSEGVIENKTVKSVSVERLWVDKNGGILKRENESSSEAIKSLRFMRSTSIYEFDPNIKIEAPIK